MPLFLRVQPRPKKEISLSTILAFYSDFAHALEAQRRVRQKGFRRAWAIHSTTGSPYAGAPAILSRYRVALGALVLGALLAIAVPALADSLTVRLNQTLLLVPSLLLLLFGVLSFWRAQRNTTWVSAERSRRWLLAGETLVVVDVSLERAGVALDQLRCSDGVEPATFVERPARDFLKTSFPSSPGGRLSSDQIRQHAGRLAAGHPIPHPARRASELQRRMMESQRIIQVVTGDLAQVALLEGGISIASRWLLDNGYIIAQRAREVRRQLTPQFSQSLPVFADAGGGELPRAYVLARDFISQTAGDVQEAELVDFLLAYQDVSALTLGELWALPLLLRLALIENIARLAMAVDRRQRERDRADFWASRLLFAARRSPSALLAIAAEISRDEPHPSAYSADRLISQLQGEALPLDVLSGWLEQSLGASVVEVVQQVQREQATGQEAIANAISSLRLLARLNWRTVVEHVSAVEQALRADPADVYLGMDFDTRDRYRRAVEQIARGSGRSEVEIARAVVALAKEGESDGFQNHVGYYLIDVGRSRFEERVVYRPPLRTWLRRCLQRSATFCYLGAIALATVGMIVGLLALARELGVVDFHSAALVLLIGLAVLPASELAIQLVNRGVSWLLPPVPLSKLSFAAGIPDTWRTLVVVPVLFQTVEGVQNDLSMLEIRFLANRDPNLHFAVVADLPDAPERELPTDALLLETAIAGIEQLNLRYPGNSFSLFYRERVWSDGERVWMGWERKRGKLEDLNHWLIANAQAGDASRAAEADAAFHYIGDLAQIRTIRFVLTLDADTQLPHGAAKQLVGTLAHPLNRPKLGVSLQTVERGYTIIQPRVSTTLPSATATRFARFFAGAAGTDPYTHAVSDVYQDLTGEGSYHGKGIYDLATFNRVLHGRFPEATLLSHDLLEGAYVRTGLATDVELFDQFPSTYRAYAAREHRWMRGDWQISQWSSPRVPDSDGISTPNPLSAMNRWKILDNLRRSLLSPVSLALLVANWLAAPSAALLGTILVAGTLLLPVLLQTSNWISRWWSDDRPRPPTAAAWGELSAGWAGAAIHVALLPHQALVAVDAISRVWLQRAFSHRHALQWRTAEHASVGTLDQERRLRRELQVISLASLVLAAGLVWIARQSLPFAAPFLLLWGLSPLLAAWLDGRSARPEEAALAPPDRRFLRRIARRTWRYFDDQVGPETNWLPPDNQQVALRVAVAERTSPTNIGLMLLATVAAGDFGYLTADQIVARGLATLNTLGRLARFEGHLFNWYDTRTLAPLLPRYVSTVDSGNLLASLWAVVQGFRDLLAQPVIGSVAFSGLVDLLDLVDEAAAQSLAAQVSGPACGPMATLRTLLGTAPQAPEDVLGRLADALAAARALSRVLADRPRIPVREPARGRGSASVFEPVASDPGEEAAYWASKLDALVTSWDEVAGRYLRWVSHLADCPADLPPGVIRAARELHELCRTAIPSLADLSAPTFQTWEVQFAGFLALPDLAETARIWLTELVAYIAEAHREAVATSARVDQLIAATESIAEAMNLRFLYDPAQDLFSIGYNVETQQLDSSHYDLLASESRLGSFVAIARGDVPVEHWLALGRPFGITDGHWVLLSWTGTMFEYLMPLLLTESYAGSLLDAACREAVATQISYGAARHRPWGISEAAYSATDANGTYQYQAFGVPELALRRSVDDNLVVAPYASALALAVAPVAALRNLRRLSETGATGRYGYYESVDYPAPGESGRQAAVPVYTYMAHHQGMTFLAIDNALHDNVFRARFHRDPRVRAFEPLLFERLPLTTPVVASVAVGEGTTLAPEGLSLEGTVRFPTPNASTPRVHLLGNGSYAVMVTAAGAGVSRWRDLDVSRWQADTTLDSSGSFCYIHDVDDGTTWSPTYQPLVAAPGRYEVRFNAERAEFERWDNGIHTLLEIVVSPEEDAEIRRLTLINHSDRRRSLELTSYVELALAAARADREHPAFSKLFVESMALPDQHALLAWRRRRGPQESAVWAIHALLLPPDVAGAVSYETDRARFLGRGRDLANPEALSRPLGNSAGAVLDPIFSLRVPVELERGERLQVSYVTGAADTREQALAIVETYQNSHAVARAFELAWLQAQLEPGHLRVTAAELHRFEQLAGYLLYPSARLRAGEQQIRQNQLGQARLWTHGISGDLPIVVATIANSADLDLVREILVAHTFWSWRGLRSDLLILNEEMAGYHQPLQAELRSLIQAHGQYTGVDQPGGVFLRATQGMSTDDRRLLLAAARVVLVAARGSLTQQLSAPAETFPLPPAGSWKSRGGDDPTSELPVLPLRHANGSGGFSADGKEYVIELASGACPPRPWVNLLANPSFGALVSESGSGFVWSENSQQNRLLPWSNDPIADPSGDALFLRDEETGLVWTTTASPIREAGAYRARHGQGYSVFEHPSHGIGQELLTFVPIDESGGEPVRIQRLRLRNETGRRRRLSVTAYCTWVLGGTREDTQMHVVTTWDPAAQALFARNAFHPDFGGRVAFLGASLPISSYTADRAEFLGRNGSLRRPAGLTRQSLSGRTGAGLDPCAAIQVSVELAPGADAEVTFLLGEAANASAARDVVLKFREAGRVERALQATRDWWDGLLGTVEIETPDSATNLMLNRWLLYQTLSARVWARSGFYQSGGAFGFRDQLQDVAALVYAAPSLTRAHLLAAAARQFQEGDVQHWWHPQSGAGVRTRVSDDPLWLPYVTAQYVRKTGDLGVLDELVPFLEAPPLTDEESERYFVPTVSSESASLLDHCRRAVAKVSGLGPHLLPLIGSGDWNDGFNLVGIRGQGESVWLAFFLIEVLNEFAGLLDLVGQVEEAGTLRLRERALVTAVEREAWDGGWYRRAFFDDGTPLGSRESSEATIDSLPQSWGVISGGAAPERARLALQAVDERLVLEQARLILLFAPPFDVSIPSPGYVQSYPPGIRENGGQYTHAAVWLALAHARRGDGNHAVHLLDLLNPINHARTAEDVQRYQVEPYVVAADIYNLANHVGKGGWTWYTGSSGWLYRVWLEDILGFKLQGDCLTLDPTLPGDWPTARIFYRYRTARYEILLENPEHTSHGVAWVEADDVRQAGASVQLTDDGGFHRIRCRLGFRSPGPEEN